jgi:hypothetical protein
MLLRLSEGTSYGIPVGPPASRLLGEAVLIDVDSTLLSFGIDFIKYVDDFVIFAGSAQDAEYGLRVLAETLFLGHGLTLQTAKTKVLAASDYLERHLALHTEKEENRRKLLDIFGEGEYEITSYEDLDEDQRKEIDAFNLSEILNEALAEGENVDYREVSFILGRLSALQKPELIPIVLENLERLYPVAEAVSAFFKQFTNLTSKDGREISEALLAPILNAPKARPSDYYYIWILSVFEHHGNWNHAENLGFHLSSQVLAETELFMIQRGKQVHFCVCAGLRPSCSGRIRKANRGTLLRARHRTNTYKSPRRMGSYDRRICPRSGGPSAACGRRRRKTRTHRTAPRC